MKTEMEMREAKVPFIKTEQELLGYLKTLVERDHDYGTCVYAMSMAAEAAFNYVSSKLGVTGFQASCADLDFIRRTRNFEGPFMLVDAAQQLYPQYHPLKDTEEFLSSESTTQWLAKQAREKISESDQSSVHPDVWSHWEQLASQYKEEQEQTDG